MGRAGVGLLLLGIMAASLVASQASPEAEVRSVIERFEKALNDRDLTAIEKLVADDLVALENGHRNDGWQDFRDHHLVPEMKEPAPPSRGEVIRVVATPEMSWGYSKTEMTLTRKTGEKAEALLWSVYILQKRQGQWKIVLLDWSMRVQRPAAR